MALPFTIRIQLLLLRAVGFLIGLIGQAARAFGGPKFSSGTTRPVTEPLLLLSGVQLAKLIRQRKVKCIDVVQAYINRIKDVNPMINGIVKYRVKLAGTADALGEWETALDPERPLCLTTQKRR
ncbi:fatty-acid amide hydrolase 2 isoform X5 [Sus scrofa]|uniref:fatty-acid amide hydrolase 2 isoform X5 n=1 Tax=Sus scrofa TaxID=9823 RepID=UPI0006B21769|nr:fatty-acid amide hydrolase 2 isoform X5 [Sus scrofa]